VPHLVEQRFAGLHVLLRLVDLRFEVARPRGRLVELRLHLRQPVVLLPAQRLDLLGALLALLFPLLAIGLEGAAPPAELILELRQHAALLVEALREPANLLALPLL
jgi:hypothetical protein